MCIGKIRISVLAVTVLFIVGCAFNFCHAGVSQNLDKHFYGNNLKVMTFNIRVDTILDGFNGWKNRKQMAIDIIKSNDADVFGLQEALGEQLKDIQESLRGYSNYAMGRNKKNNTGESCAIFFRRDRFVMIDSGTFWFSKTPDKPGSKGWGNIPPRICSWVHLFDSFNGSAFYVYNVHMDNLSQNSRKKSAKLLTERILNRETDDPFIVLGDFNMKLNNSAMKTFLNNPKLNMVDAWQSTHPGQKGKGTRHNFRGSLSGPKIDHIPLSNGFKAINVSIDRRHIRGKYPSDHYPVVANVLLLKPQYQSLHAYLRSESKELIF